MVYLDVLSKKLKSKTHWTFNLRPKKAWRLCKNSFLSMLSGFGFWTCHPNSPNQIKTSLALVKMGFQSLFGNFFMDFWKVYHLLSLIVHTSHLNEFLFEWIFIICSLRVWFPMNHFPIEFWCALLGHDSLRILFQIIHSEKASMFSYMNSAHFSKRLTTKLTLNRLENISWFFVHLSCVSTERK